MAKNLAISILATLCLGTVASEAAVGGSKKVRLLFDGFVLSGVEGKLSQDSNDVWFFEFDSDVSDGRNSVKAGTSLELLPSAALEKAAAEVKVRSEAGYRLWGKVTKYRDKNFIFSIYFLPVSKIEQPKPSTSRKLQRPVGGLTINEPNDVLTIPQEIIDKIQTRRVVRPEQLRKGLELEADSILVGRTGFIVDESKGYSLFVLDALGRGVQEISLRLLPCQALEWAQYEQSAEPEPLRFKVAGVVTKYKGENFLLLQRATRVYSHGNFGR